MTPVPAWSMPGAELYVGDAIDTLTALPEGSVDCLVSSPPYWGLRDYGTGVWSGGDPDCAHTPGRGSNVRQSKNPRVTYPAGAHRGGDPRTCPRCGAVRDDRQYGLEPSPQAYVENLRAVFAEVRRVLSATGTVWLNLGDSFSTNPPATATHPGRANTPHSGQAAATARRHPAGMDHPQTLPRKNLCGLPWRVALALQEDGYLIRNAIVWAKTNPMPESVRDRLTATYEFLFLLTKQPHYHFDLDAIRVPLLHPHALTEGLVIGGSNKGRHGGIGATARRRGHSVYGSTRRRAHPTRRDPGPDRGGGKYRESEPFTRGRHGDALRPTGTSHHAHHPRGKNPGDVWRLPTRPLREAHFAAFPVDLPLRAIAAGCPEGGLVADPFSGAGTTGLAALHLGRRYLGIDLSAAHTAIAARRLAAHHPTGGQPAARPADHGTNERDTP